MLSKERVERFRRDGFLVAGDAVDARQLAALRDTLAGWVEESRAHDAPFGAPTVDGRPRFDLTPEHPAASPALRRVDNPSEIDEGCMEGMRDSAMTDMVADLIGPDVKHHHCKINLKLPGAGRPAPLLDQLQAIAMVRCMTDRAIGAGGPGGGESM